MIFLHPWLLLLIIPVLFVAIIYFFKTKQNDLTISLVDTKTSYASAFDKLGFYLPFLLRIVVLILIVIMLARPQIGESYTVNKHNGLDIFFAVDTSQSMSAADLRLNGRAVDRLTVLKKILIDFVKKRSSDRLGLLVFGEEAFTQCPLTLDHGAILDLISHLEIGMVGNATAIGSAIAIGVKRLKDLPAKSKILILMTDGQNTAGNISPEVATELARELGIKIYAIGIGQEGEIPMKIDTPFGPLTVMQQTVIDEDLLVQMSESTGGKYFRAKNTEELEKIYNYIDKLEKTEVQVKEYNSYSDVYEKLLWAAFLLFMVELGLANTVFYRVS